MKKTLLLVALLLVMVQGRAQSGQQRLGTQSAVKTLVCYCENWDASVVYERTLAGQNHLYWIEAGDSAGRKADLPSDLEINDMECLGDTLWFGGRHIQDKLGVAGFFDVHGLFFQGARAEYCEILPVSGAYESTLKAVEHIALYGQGPVVHVAFVGRMQIGSIPEMGTVGEVRWDRSQRRWESDYFYNKDGVDNYTDICTTQDYVVSVGKRLSNGRCFVRAWEQTSRFLLAPLTPGHLAEAYDEVYGDAVLTTHTEDDVFAVAYRYGNEETHGMKMVLLKANPIDGIMFFDGMKIVPDQGHRYNISDFAYQPYAQMLLLAHDWQFDDENPFGYQAGFVSWFDPSNPYPNYKRVKHSHYVISTVDRVSTFGYGISCFGWDLGTLEFHYNDFSNSGDCHLSETHSNESHSVELIKVGINEDIAEPKPIGFLHLPIVTDDFNSIICRSNQ